MRITNIHPSVSTFVDAGMIVKYDISHKRTHKKLQYAKCGV